MPTITFEQAKSSLAAIGQDHLLNFYTSLDAAAQAALLAQIAELDLASIPAMIDGYVKNKPTFALPPNLGPAPYYPRNEKALINPWNRAEFEEKGNALLRAGKVAGFVVAGGQGSRLGFEGPKGCYPAGAVTNKPLFEIFAQHFIGAKQRYGVSLPWYIMTSPLNHEATVGFFKLHNYFGLDPANIMFFPQGTLPSIDMATGKILLASKSEIATNPDGHGGSFRALAQSGALADMKRRGIEHLSYFQVDNPIVRIFDPAFIGLHAHAKNSSAEMSSKMTPKAYPEEKVGIFCSSNGKVEVIEYSDLPMDLQRERLPDGSLRFIAGSIAIHLISVNFIERIASDPKFALPYHRAEKKIPCIDPTSGEPITPTANNGVKLEKFVFDALSLCASSIVYETDRIEEFAPIKNATGLDSPQTCREIQTLRNSRWLEARGVKIPKTPDGTPNCTIEISPVTATSPAELPTSLPTAIAPGSTVLL